MAEQESEIRPSGGLTGWLAHTMWGMQGSPVHVLWGWRTRAETTEEQASAMVGNKTKFYRIIKSQDAATSRLFYYSGWLECLLLVVASSCA